MSTFKKSSLAAAIVLGLGLSAAAAAYTVTTGGDTDPVMVATADVTDADTVIGVDEATTITLESSDFILGRTTGFTLRVALNDGATFGNTLTTADLSVGLANSTWTPTIAAGGAAGDSTVVINMNPAGSPTALTTGDLLTFDAADFVAGPTTGVGAGLILSDLEVLQDEGATVSATVTFVDPTSADAIMGAEPVTLLQSGDPVVLACDTESADSGKRIDVGSDEDHDAKTYFSWDGTIGELNSGTMDLGTVNIEVAEDFDSFSYTSTDEFTTVITGDFSAFDTETNDNAGGVYLATEGCGSGGIYGVVDGNTVTFEYTGAEAGIGPDGVSLEVCAEVGYDNAVVIDDTTASVATTFTRGDVVASGASCNLQPLRYNGSVVDVYHINPAGNTTAQSYIRIINPSSQGGTVTLVGTDDNGIQAPVAVSFYLPENSSKQINSEDLEGGNPVKGFTGMWGNGAGKWRAEVTGEFAGMRVQSMNRNGTDGTVTNLTDSDGQGEQYLNSYYDNGEED